MNSKTDIAVVGGGAAGFFAAIHAAAEGKHKVVLIEKTGKLLTKVGVSGGGRCNVTHDAPYASQLVKMYPRGGNTLKKSFELFGSNDTVRWFERHGVALKTEADGRMFPVTNSSQTIVDCLLQAAYDSRVQIQTKRELLALSHKGTDGFELETKDGSTLICRKVILTMGGFNNMAGYSMLYKMGIKIKPPVPSLFTFNVPQSDLKDLMGLSVPHATVQVPGSKWKEEGPVLITHWGFSAPAVIKLSSWAAIDLHGLHYHFPILINWTGMGEEALRLALKQERMLHPKRVITINPQFGIPGRLWERLCAKSGITRELLYADFPAKLENRLVEVLIRCPYEVKGKTTFKEEFVTCGGVDLAEVDLRTFESKKIPGLYCAGELLNVDGLTGGYNFQHAWTSGFLAGQAAAKSLG